MPIELARLNLFTLHSFRPVLAANVLAALERTGPSRVGFGAWDEDGPAGAAVLALAPGEDADVVWLYVRAAKRRLGLASRLMEALQTAAAESGRRRLRLLYPAREQAGVWHRMLLTLGWTLHSQRGRRIRVSARGIMHAAWFERSQVPRSLQLSGWAELCVDDRQQLHAATAELPSSLRPSQLEAGCDLATSVVLRRGGRVLGWLFTHFIDPKALAYSALFVWPELRGTGLAFAMVSEAVRRHIQTYGEDSVGVILASAENAAVMRIVEGALAPYVVHSSEVGIAERGVG